MLVAALLAGISGWKPARAAEEEGDEIVVADFSEDQRGAFPEGWKAVWARDSKGADVYTVAGETTRSYLKADAEGTDILIAKEFEYDLKAFPFLRWTWRAMVLPEGADERRKDRGDSGAAVYVVFPGRFRPDNIKYVWSSSLSKGTVTESPYNSRTKIVVLRNDSSPLGKWMAEEVNVYEDYRRLFNDEPEMVQAIAIMSDANNTESRAVAHYGEIRVGKTSRPIEREVESPGMSVLDGPEAAEAEPVAASPGG